MQPSMKQKGLSLKISVTDTEIFQELLAVLKSASEDERIDLGVRREITDKILAIVKEVE